MIWSGGIIDWFVCLATDGPRLWDYHYPGSSLTGRSISMKMQVLGATRWCQQSCGRWLKQLLGQREAGNRANCSGKKCGYVSGITDVLKSVGYSCKA